MITDAQEATLSAESNARAHAEAFRWWRGAPELTEREARRRDLEALRDAVAELIVEWFDEDDLMLDEIGDPILLAKAALARPDLCPRIARHSRAVDLSESLRRRISGHD
ncbi:hypothetical protein [Brevibacterium sp. W7.2]|uniref:hypothetical protein n=1 Tax=Brevibacterium sp. W7.2 TaxID=2823518 RepID=UPI001BAD4590|nr:hypothetical protein [Brevibacterium sp. W7.2]